jgi:hypothetical protein
MTRRGHSRFGHAAAGAQAPVDHVERRDPLAHEVCPVAAAKEPLAPAVDHLILLMPAVAGAGPESLADRLAGAYEPDCDLERAQQEYRAVLVGERLTCSGDIEKRAASGSSST